MRQGESAGRDLFFFTYLREGELGVGSLLYGLRREMQRGSFGTCPEKMGQQKKAASREHRAAGCFLASPCSSISSSINSISSSKQQLDEICGSDEACPPLPPPASQVPNGIKTGTERPANPQRLLPPGSVLQVRLPAAVV